MNLLNYLATLCSLGTIPYDRLPSEGRNHLAGSSFACSVGASFKIAPGKYNELVALVRGIPCAPLLDVNKALPYVTPQEKAYLKLLRTFAHGVTAINIAAVRNSLVHKGVIRSDSRDAGQPSRKQRFFVKKQYRNAVDRS
jgi:hypothetical protein